MRILCIRHQHGRQERDTGLGIWISENESASFWLTICNELKNRGVQDILIACRDNLNGFFGHNSHSFPKVRAATVRHSSNPQLHKIRALQRH